MDKRNLLSFIPQHGQIEVDVWEGEELWTRETYLVVSPSMDR